MVMVVPPPEGIVELLAVDGLTLTLRVLPEHPSRDRAGFALDLVIDQPGLRAEMSGPWDLGDALTLSSALAALARGEPGPHEAGADAAGHGGPVVRLARVGGSVVPPLTAPGMADPRGDEIVVEVWATLAGLDWTVTVDVRAPGTAFAVAARRIELALATPFGRSAAGLRPAPGAPEAPPP